MTALSLPTLISSPQGHMCENDRDIMSAIATPMLEEACRDVFDGLERLENILSKKRFLVGDHFSEADLRLIPTAVRFDAVYASLFKCSTK